MNFDSVGGALLGKFITLLVSVLTFFLTQAGLVHPGYSGNQSSEAAVSKVAVDSSPAAIAEATNSWRELHAVARLDRSPVLSAAAQRWANSMAASRDFRHDNLGSYLNSAGQRLVMSQNIFYSRTPAAPEDIIKAWNASRDGHAENQNFAHHQEIGVGVAYDSDGGMWVVQNFGTPLVFAEALRAAIR
ncbi:hypothetical protein CPHO_02090 [Corynebacterium phocae]|uniref:SCP domain-containing protein n=1 Tax=Corynebacterium phocae TaxID=161895 RepID=A0A1L7D168_9CORY|nr:CAP domain-containing protein [Corynebacterium phocae]APT91896.1 hypothetical protein CPHO_02090 [Corynebacterium phocae]KAA8727397.1 CAP domain-containing protein [Corynebacterium phocae]